MSIKIGIMGYGNLGKGVEIAVKDAGDMELVAVFTRRDPSTVKIRTEDIPVVDISEAEHWVDKIDVLIMCGGSAKDLPVHTPKFSRLFNIVDSFDTHAKINEHFKAADKAASDGGKVAIISAGWDPGMFSVNRLYSNAILPDGRDYTFWGKGVSQGHSDAIRRIDGVKNAKQYTIPVEASLDVVRKGEEPELNTRQKHIRECFVVLEEGADGSRIEKEIMEMPYYFADYDTIVNFIDDEEFETSHGSMAHGGFVFRSGRTGYNKEHKHIIEYSLKLDSNPEFTTSVLVAYARAAKRLYDEGKKGCFTVFDIPPSYLSHKSAEELRKTIL